MLFRSYLVNNMGTSATNSEIASILFEDKPYDRSLQSQIQTIISALMKTLKHSNAESIIIKVQNGLMIDPSKFSCDYYEYLNGNRTITPTDYMHCYSWAEDTAAKLEFQNVS